jgi:hypothetical protein
LPVSFRFGLDLAFNSRGVLAAGVEFCPLRVDPARGLVRAGLQLSQPGGAAVVSKPRSGGLGGRGFRLGWVWLGICLGPGCWWPGLLQLRVASGCSGVRFLMPASGFCSGGHGWPSETAAWCSRWIARSMALASAWGDAMAEKKPLLLYAAAYETVEAALADLDAIELAHMQEMVGQYDAAVIDKEDGKPHVVKRMDRPHIRVIPEWFGGGTLPRKELHEAAEQLTANQAGLVAVGEPTIEKGLDKVLTKAAKVVKRTVEATTDEITSELQEALKS